MIGCFGKWRRAMKIKRLTIDRAVGLTLDHPRWVLAFSLYRAPFHVWLRGGEKLWLPIGVFGSKKALTLAMLFASITFCWRKR